MKFSITLLQQERTETKVSRNCRNFKLNKSKLASLNSSISNSTILSVPVSMTGSKYGLVFNQEGDFIKERKFYSKIIKKLFSKMENINKKDNNGNTILHLACRTGNIAFVKKIMMNEDEMINLTNKDDQSILFPA